MTRAKPVSCQPEVGKEHFGAIFSGHSRRFPLRSRQKRPRPRAPSALAFSNTLRGKGIAVCRRCFLDIADIEDGLGCQQLRLCRKSSLLPDHCPCHGQPRGFTIAQQIRARDRALTAADLRLLVAASLPFFCEGSGTRFLKRFRGRRASSSVSTVSASAKSDRSCCRHAVMSPHSQSSAAHGRWHRPRGYWRGTGCPALLTGRGAAHQPGNVDKGSIASR